MIWDHHRIVERSQAEWHVCARRRLQANLWFYGGVLFFGVVVYFIPEPSAADTMIASGEQPLPDAGASKAAIKVAKDERRQRKHVLMSGIITALGFSLLSKLSCHVVLTSKAAEPISRCPASLGANSGMRAVNCRDLPPQFS